MVPQENSNVDQRINTTITSSWPIVDLAKSSGNTSYEIYDSIKYGQYKKTLTFNEDATLRGTLRRNKKKKAKINRTISYGSLRKKDSIFSCCSVKDCNKSTEKKIKNIEYSNGILSWTKKSIGVNSGTLSPNSNTDETDITSDSDNQQVAVKPYFNKSQEEEPYYNFPPRHPSHGHLKWKGYQWYQPELITDTNDKEYPNYPIHIPTQTLRRIVEDCSSPQTTSSSLVTNSPNNNKRRVRRKRTTQPRKGQLSPVEQKR